MNLIKVVITHKFFGTLASLGHSGDVRVVVDLQMDEGQSVYAVT